MNTKLQNKAWSVLPKEFKEKVKKMFQKDINTCNNMNQAMRCILVDIFGLHNLTSDEEGEEMLSIERILIQSYYNAHKNSRDILYDLFGPKCLRDEPASEPKSETNKHFDNILKDSFRNERRLNIATQILSSILSNQRMLNNLAHGETTVEGVVRCVVDATMMYTDALIAECEEGGKS